MGKIRGHRKKIINMNTRYFGKASELDNDTLIEKIMKNDTGIILIEADAKSAYDILAEGSSFDDRIGIYGTEGSITVHLYPLLYSTGNTGITPELTKSRMEAVWNVFERWTAAGYNKRGAKSPFSSKAFQEYRDNIGFIKADYMVLMVD